MNISKRGFSFIEIIVSVSIIVIISIVAITTHSSMVDKSNNSKILSDVNTIENSLTSYKQEQSTLPLPQGNLKYFKEDTSYSHDMEDAFGVSGFITQDTIPAKYMNYFPSDPKTGQYYAISITSDKNNFEIAGVTKKNESYKSIVNGNWTGENGPYSLVREYNGPNFVYDESIENFPYNPEELLLTAKINSFSGEILINGQTYNENEIIKQELREGDEIEVGTGSYAELYLSDGSYSTLGDNDSKTKITLSNMRYVEENNLFTNVKIVLDMGSIWTKASKLGEKSDYEIYTTDTIAAVRGTIFGLRKIGLKTIVSLIEGEIEVKKLSNSYTYDELNKDIILDANNITTTYVTEIPGTITGSGIIEVKKGESPISLEIENTSNTGNIKDFSEIIEKTPNLIKDKIIDNVGEINTSMQLKIIEINNNSGEKKVKIQLNETLKKGNIVKINDNNLNSYLPTNDNILVLSGSDIFNNGKNSISICKYNNCTQELIIDFSSELSFVENDNEREITRQIDEAVVERDNSIGVTSDDNDECIRFGSEGCYELVAEALYDENFDLEKVGGNEILAEQQYLDDTAYEYYNRLSNTFYDYSSGKNSYSSNLPDYVEKIYDNKAIYKWGNKGTGVFLDNYSIGGDDYLKYNIGDLNLGNNFAIEISVRGAALKRNNSYYLFTLADDGYNYNENSLGFGLNGGKIRSSINDNGTFRFKNLITPNNSNENEFYKVQVFIDNKVQDGYKEVHVIACIESQCSEKIKIDGYKNLENTTNIFIGSGNEKNYQWNDIIDYVKIYKK